MKVAWLADAFDPPGGAELTQAELRAAAPAGVRIVDVGPGELDAIAGCDLACVHNTATYPDATAQALERLPVIRYWHDMAWAGGALVRWLAEHATSVFTSPLHRERFPHPVAGESHVIPPALALSRYAGGNGKRSRGACWLGSGRHVGKGVLQACEWAEEHEPVDFWGDVDVQETARVRSKGRVPPEHVPTILRLYQRFVFLPTHTEPFGRAVVEAWAAGCELIVNRNVGALHWLDQPEALETAAADYWELVCGS